MNAQTKMMLAAIAGGVALGFGAASVFGGTVTPGTQAPAHEELAAQLHRVESDRAALQQAALESQERIAAIAEELERARMELDALRAAQTLAAAEAALDDDAFWEAEMEDTMAFAEADGPTFRTDAELQESLAANRPTRGEGRQWDPERVAQMRAERDERIQGFFDEAFERAPSRESQERLAAIETYTHDAMELARQWRGASESEREELREQMGSMRETMRDLVRDEHDARVRSIAESYGVNDVNQQQALADAIREVQSDPIFRGGGAWTGGRTGGGGGGPAPMWGGGRGRGGQPGR